MRNEGYVVIADALKAIDCTEHADPSDDLERVLHEHLLLVREHDLPGAEADGVSFDPLAELDKIAAYPTLGARALARERRRLALAYGEADAIDDEDISVYFATASALWALTDEHEHRRNPDGGDHLPHDAAARGERLLATARREVAQGLSGYDAGFNTGGGEGSRGGRFAGKPYA